MRTGWVVPIALVASLAFAVPGDPVPVTPIDGGWCARACELTWRFTPFTAETVGAEVEVMDSLGTVVATRFDVITTPPVDEWTTPALSDAGPFSWRVRGRDDAGLLSPWSMSPTFLVDGISPAAPTPFTADLDGGVLRLTAAPVVDDESGFLNFHFGLSGIDQLDGSVFFTNSFNLQQTSGTRDLFIGPGTWLAGVHAHDRVDNAGTSAVAGPLVVSASQTLPIPAAPEVVRSDAGAWLLYPYVSSDTVRLRLDAGGVPVTGWAVSRKLVSGTDWFMAGSAASAFFAITLPVGEVDVRVALVSGTEVSAWSPPTRIWLDEVDPLSLTLTARVDGGLVTLSWPYGRDSSAGNSGVREYHVRRDGADASVAFAPVPHVSMGTITFSDTPGFGRWSFSVSSMDRAGHEGPIATAVVDLAPMAPLNLRVARAVTNQPVALSWDDDRDGGFVQTWTLMRVDAADASVVAAGLLASTSVDDDAPEGRWSYELFAKVEGVQGPASRLDGVVRDVTPPTVSVPSLSRLGARGVEVSFSADDALAGLERVVLERDPVSLGAVASPFTDTPPDGMQRYRVVATDLAGNVKTGDWSEALTFPGPGVVIEPLEALNVQCGAVVDQTFAANEPVSWSIEGAPSSATLEGERFVWSPSADEVGTHLITVRAQGATSADAREWRVDVSCARLVPKVGCACNSVDPTLVALVLAVVLGRRRVHR